MASLRNSALGRMGSNIIRTICEQEDMKVVAAIEVPNHPKKGEDVGELIGIGKIGVPLSTSDEMDKVLKETKPDVLVDFTIAHACVETVKIATKNKVKLIIGTTGFNEEQKKEIENAIKENNVSAVISQNFAIGVNIFFKTLEFLAKKLGHYDIEIVEMHHRFKKDAPSGTDLTLAESAAKARNLNIDQIRTSGRNGNIGEREKDEIAVMALRGGDIVGEHTVGFYNDGEFIELNHTATSRDTFAKGAIFAGKWLVNQKNNSYTIQDCLNIQ